MKYFPLVVHVVLACAAIGLAAGMGVEGVRPSIHGAAIGLATGLGITALGRVLFWAAGPL